WARRTKVVTGTLTRHKSSSEEKQADEPSGSSIDPDDTFLSSRAGWGRNLDAPRRDNPPPPQPLPGQVETLPLPSPQRAETPPPPSPQRDETPPPPSPQRDKTPPPPEPQRDETPPPPSPQRDETPPPSEPASRSRTPSDGNATEDGNVT
ncbi:hypothetical protein H0H93_000585, partial [Arthromyces matolae]